MKGVISLWWGVLSFHFIVILNFIINNFTHRFWALYFSDGLPLGWISSYNRLFHALCCIQLWCKKITLQSNTASGDVCYLWDYIKKCWILWLTLSQYYVTYTHAHFFLEVSACLELLHSSCLAALLEHYSQPTCKKHLQNYDWCITYIVSNNNLGKICTFTGPISTGHIFKIHWLWKYWCEHEGSFS